MKYEVVEEGRHPFNYPQDSSTDDELETAEQLGIRVSGTNDLGEEWDFWLKRVGLSTNWRDSRQVFKPPRYCMVQVDHRSDC